MTIAKQLRTVLGPAIDAARAALRDLDDKDVPARLRPIAKKGDGTLPVPLVTVLIRRIDEDDWFRSKALESFEREGLDDPVSGAYLRREDGWWISVCEAVAGIVEADGGVQRDRLAHDLGEMRRRSRADRAKAKALRKAGDDAARTARATIEERIGPLKSAAAEARAERDHAERRADRLRTEVEEVRGDRLEAERTAATLGEQLRAAKRTIADLRRAAEEGSTESLPRDPIERARWLDRTAAMVAPYREAGTTGEETAPGDGFGPPGLPAGIAPDSPEAIDSFRGADGIVVIVDGHNLLGVLDASTMASSRARKTLIVALGRLVRHLGSSSSVEVVFDSGLRDGRPVSKSDSGVVVRFAPEDAIADDVIVDLAEEYGTEAVVVSDDREVRERASRHGATALWAQALADWLRE